MLNLQQIFSFKKANYKTLAIVALVFTVIGFVTLLLTQAATTGAETEAEKGDLAGNAIAMDEDNTSGNKFVRLNGDQPTGTPTPSTTPPPNPGTSADIWISRDELMALPDSGAAWNNLTAAATGNPGAADLSDNNSTHDTSTLALAYHGVRTGNQAEIDQAADEIATIFNSPRARALEFSRNITCYIIAADVINLAEQDPALDTEFRAFIKQWVMDDTSLQGHSGGGVNGIRITAEKAPNNWGGMARAAYAATARYLGDTAALDNVAIWHKGMLGDRDVYSAFLYTDTNWHADPNAKRGINAPGATIQGQNVDGVIPEDQRRTEDFAWPAPKGSYPWEAMQGLAVTDVILQRAGKITNDYYHNAIVRAYTWLYDVNDNPASGDDAWQPWLANKMYGTNFPLPPNPGAGKLMGWTDWTHGN